MDSKIEANDVDVEKYSSHEEESQDGEVFSVEAATEARCVFEHLLGISPY